jgi:hypothetical protein
MIRSAIASLGVAATILIGTAAAPTPAPAQVNIDINIGIGTNLSARQRVSCARGELLLRSRGFRNIERRDCRGRFFVYRATRRGDRFEIAIRASDGQIVDFRRVGRR